MNAKLFEEINHISLNHDSLLEVFVEYYNNYIMKQSPLWQSFFDSLWDSEYFIEQGVISSREAIVLSMMAITLDESVSFDDVINNCINFQAQNINISKLREYFSNKNPDKIIRSIDKEKKQSFLNNLNTIVINSGTPKIVNSVLLKEELSDETVYAKLLDLFSNLRKELFSRTYSQNKEMQKMTGLPRELILNRYDKFFKVISLQN